VNVASFVGAATVRIHELRARGDVDPTPEQLARMRGLVKAAMEDGAMGVGSSIIYAPGNLCRDAGTRGAGHEAGKCGASTSATSALEGDRLVRRWTS